MKKLKLVALLPLFAIAFFIVSCGDGHSHDENGNHTDETTEQTEAEVDKTGKEYTSAFICPMHCPGSGSDAAGTCPACGMDYVANEDYQSNSEAAEEDHGDQEGHDHDDHEGHNH